MHRNGTSMISLIIPPKDQIPRVSAMLANEFGTASNIKSRVNRLSVLGAITSVQQRLKLYNRGTILLLYIQSCITRLLVRHHDAIHRTSAINLQMRCLAVPPNGLLIYCGTILTEDGKERKVNIDFEPFRAINTSLYLCDNKFHTEALSALLTDDSRFGFLVMDGSGALFGVVSGNTREIITKFSVDLPKKHGARADQ